MQALRARLEEPFHDVLASSFLEKGKNTADYYAEHGFRVLGRIKGTDALRRAQYASLFKLMKSDRSREIFDEDVGEPGRRRQFNLHSEGYSNENQPAYNISFMLPIHEEVTELAPGIKSQCRFFPSLLYSPGEGDFIQPPHFDLPKKRNTDNKFLLLVALMDHTTIIVFRKSHKEHYTYDNIANCTPVRIILNKGEVLQFHPNLVHCGDAYEARNVRLHYYVLHYHAELADLTVFPSLETIERCNNPVTRRSAKRNVTVQKKKMRKSQLKARRSANGRTQVTRINAKKQEGAAATPTNIVTEAIAVEPSPPSMSAREKRCLRRRCDKFYAEIMLDYGTNWNNAEAEWEANARALKEIARAPVGPPVSEVNNFVPGAMIRTPWSWMVDPHVKASESSFRYSNLDDSDESECRVVYAEEED